MIVWFHLQTVKPRRLFSTFSLPNTRVLRYCSDTDVSYGNIKSNDCSALATHLARYNSQPPDVTGWMLTWAPINSKVGKLYGTTPLSSYTSYTTFTCHSHQVCQPVRCQKENDTCHDQGRFH